MAGAPGNATNINATTAGVMSWDGTATVSTSAITQYDVLVGGASQAISSVAPGATAGVPLVSNGSGAPSFTTATVAGGGTGVATMTTAYAPVCAGTTATGALQVASTGLGTSGYVLTSNGSSALPSFKILPSSSVVFYANLANTVTNATGGGATYTFIPSNVVINTGSAYNSSTGYFTAPATGVYLITGAVTMSKITSSGTTTVNLTMYLTTGAGVTYIPLIQLAPAAAQSAQSGIITGYFTNILSMAATDNFYVYSNCTGGTNTISIIGGSFGSGGAVQSWLSGHQIA